MVDEIVEQRAGDCKKVTLVTHSTAANASLVGLSDPESVLSQKVGSVVNLAPCLGINVNNFWMTERDLPSIEALYGALR